MPADGGLPLVTGAIPAISADEQKATLTFTQEAWAHVHQVLEAEFPADEQIVGWYHSHPSFGIFLSGHDLFIHENFFNASSQIAVVVDPINCREGAFGWRDGKLEALYERATAKRWRVPSEVLESLQPRRVEETRVVVAPEPAITLSTRVVALVSVIAGRARPHRLAVRHRRARRIGELSHARRARRPKVSPAAATEGARRDAGTLMPDRMATPEDVGRPCPYCRFPLKEGVPVHACESCGSVHHAECWGDGGGCAVFGCAAAGTATAVSQAPAPATQAYAAPPAYQAVPEAPVGIRAASAYLCRPTSSNRRALERTHGRSHSPRSWHSSGSRRESRSQAERSAQKAITRLPL